MKKLSLSEKNNNPLNIRASVQDSWKGQTGINKGFAVFLDDAYGYRAAIYLLLKYMVDYKLTTPAKIISRWAPPNENMTEEYIRKVCERSQACINDQLSPDKPITKWGELVNLIFCMTEVERGRPIGVYEKNGFLVGVELCYKYKLPVALRKQMSKLIANDE